MTLKQGIAVLAVLAVGFFAGTWVNGRTEAEPKAAVEKATYRCPMHPTVVYDHPGTCPICGMDLVKDQGKTPAEYAEKNTGERKILYWRAPMDANFISDKPGKSPMGMDLIPVYEDEVMGGGGVKIDPATMQNIGVKSALVERRALSRTVRTVGRVDYDETRISDVNTKIAGWVEKLLVDYTGQAVKKGQPLLEIYSPDLVAAQEEYLTALDYVARLQKQGASADVVNGARDLLRAARQRLVYWDITASQIADLEQSRQVKRTMTVYSPQEGVVVQKNVLDGAHIAAGQSLYRIADLNRVWVYADVYEYEMPWVKVGQEAEVDLPSMPGKTLAGKVTYVYPFLEAKTRTVKVRIAFDNSEMALKPDMYANVKIQPLVSRDAVVVPSQAVIHSGERNVVIVDLGEGRFMPRNVTLGVEADGVYEVLKGVSEGEKIVTSAQFLIDSESNLKAALAGMTDPTSKQEMTMAPDAGSASPAAQLH